MAHNYNVETSLEKVKRHPKYYLTGGDVHFLVENYIFRVHRYFFERESAFFREKFAVAAPPGQQPRGSSDANAFPLEDVLANDFSRFLWVFYNPKYSIYDATVEDWSAILKLAFDWRFAEVKKLCVRELEKFEIPPLQKIELYQAYELDKKLLIPSYVAMCMRAEPLSIKEGRQLGLETALLLATARESARGRPSGSPGQLCSSPVTVESEDMVSIIRDVFGIIASPPSPSLSPLENTGTASASTIPATNGMNGTTKLVTPNKGSTPSLDAATTAVTSTLASPTSTVVAAKDPAKSSGQSASTSSPTILSGRLNCVFAPMQGTARPPPLEPPPRAPSPVVQVPMVEEASTVGLPPAPTPVDETSAAQTPVLETPPAQEKPELETKLSKGQKKRRQQEKKAAQKKAAAEPQAVVGGRKTKEVLEPNDEAAPTGHSTSTPDVVSSQSQSHAQSDTPTLVDLSSGPTVTPPQTADQSTTPGDKSNEEASSDPVVGETQSTSSREPSGSLGSGPGQPAEGERNEGMDKVEAGKPPAPVPSTSTVTDIDVTAVTTQNPSEDVQTLVQSSVNDAAKAGQSAPTATSERTTPNEFAETSSVGAPTTTSAGGPDPISEGGDKTQTSGKEDKGDLKGSNVSNADVKDSKADPPAVEVPAATEAAIESASQTSTTTTTDAALGDKTAEASSEAAGTNAVKALSEGEAPQTSSGTEPVVSSTDPPVSTTEDAPTAPAAPSTAEPATAPTSEPTPNAPANATDSSSSLTAENSTSSAAGPSASPTTDPAVSSASNSSTSTSQPSEELTGASAGTTQARSETPKPGKKGKKTPGNTPVATRPSTPLNPWTRNQASAANSKPASPVVPSGPWNKNATPSADQKPTGPPAAPASPSNKNKAPVPAASDTPAGTNASISPPNAWGSKNKALAGAAESPARSSSPKPPPINTDVSSTGKVPTPSRFSSILARVTGSGSASESKKVEHAGHDSSSIPGAWNDGKSTDGGAALPSAGGSTKSSQPPELAAIAAGAKNASTANVGDAGTTDVGGWLFD